MVICLDESTEAVHKYLLPAAEAGLVHAQYALAISYECGAGVDIDTAQSARWYKAAAAQGHPGALHK